MKSRLTKAKSLRMRLRMTKVMAGRVSAPRMKKMLRSLTLRAEYLKIPGIALSETIIKAEIIKISKEVKMFMFKL